MKKIILFTGVLMLMSSTIVFSQSDLSTESSQKENKKAMKHKVVINEKMVARYQDYVENGTYTSVWETVKDYNMNEMKDFYIAYQSHDFNENTVYADIAKDAQNIKEQQMKNAPVVKKTEMLTADSEIK